MVARMRLPDLHGVNKLVGDRLACWPDEFPDGVVDGGVDVVCSNRDVRDGRTSSTCVKHGGRLSTTMPSPMVCDPQIRSPIPTHEVVKPIVTIRMQTMPMLAVRRECPRGHTRSMWPSPATCMGSTHRPRGRPRLQRGCEHYLGRVRDYQPSQAHRGR